IDQARTIYRTIKRSYFDRREEGEARDVQVAIHKTQLADRAFLTNDLHLLLRSGSDTRTGHRPGNPTRPGDVQRTENQRGDHRVFPSLRHPETARGLDFSGGSIALPPSLQVLPRPRSSAERLRHAWRERLRRRFFALFREEHRAASGNFVP